MENQSHVKLGVSGIRGIAYQALNETMVREYVSAFIGLTNASKIMVARDTRESGQDFLSWVLDELAEFGCQVTDIGIATTPTAQFMTRQLDVDAGIVVTASHNPPEYNGLKFFNAEGRYLDEIAIGELRDRYDRKIFPQKGKKENFAYTALDSAEQLHTAHVLQHIDRELIASAGLKVVIDPDGGAGAVIDPVFVKELGLSAKIIHAEPSPVFPRGTEPLPENLVLLGQAVRDFGADVGFAQDPDADRLALVDEQGNAIGEDYTLAFVVDYLLSQHPHPQGKEIVVNLSTTRLIDDIAKKYDVHVIRTKIGEMYVADAIIQTNAIIGGEGNGGVIWPVVSWGRDSISGMALILEYLARSRKKVSELVASLPKYFVVKEKVEVSSHEMVIERLQKVKDIFRDCELDFADGVKVNFAEGWLHVRASNTEPIVRYFAEATTKEQAQKWIDQVK